MPLEVMLPPSVIALPVRENPVLVPPSLVNVSAFVPPSVRPVRSFVVDRLATPKVVRSNTRLSPFTGSVLLTQFVLDPEVPELQLELMPPCQTKLAAVAWAENRAARMSA